jgi:hypothetical protein
MATDTALEGSLGSDGQSGSLDYRRAVREAAGVAGFVALWWAVCWYSRRTSCPRRLRWRYSSSTRPSRGR